MCLCVRVLSPKWKLTAGIVYWLIDDDDDDDDDDGIESTYPVMLPTVHRRRY